MRGKRRYEAIQSTRRCLFITPMGSIAASWLAALASRNCNLAKYFTRQSRARHLVWSIITRNYNLVGNIKLYFMNWLPSVAFVNHPRFQFASKAFTAHRTQFIIFALTTGYNMSSFSWHKYSYIQHIHCAIRQPAIIITLRFHAESLPPATRKIKEWEIFYWRK